MSATTINPPAYEPTIDFALAMDQNDPLAHFRERFHIPTTPQGKPAAYFCGNSLGLQPKTTVPLLQQELRDWAELAVNAHHDGATPWYSYHEVFRESGARLVGARPGAGEVVMMNALTVNLHLMMVSFFRPTPDRNCILMERGAFASDTYAIKTHLQTHRLDPATHLIEIAPRPGEHVIHIDQIEEALAKHGQRIALVLLGGVNFFTGHVLPMQRITTLGHSHGCLVGFDLAHAAGNIPMELHTWDVDFACWCSYKYLNAGPGAVAGCFIHERHGRNTQLPRFGGWWGNDPETRFRLQLEPEFVPKPDADGWQLSNPPILAMAPLRASLDIFDEATIPALRHKSIALTGFLRYLIERHTTTSFEIITPDDIEQQGCQLSIMVHDDPDGRFAALTQAGIITDFRQPNVIRVAPTPLYNTFADVWHFAATLTATQ